MSADGVVARGLQSSQGGPGRDDRDEMMMGMTGLRKSDAGGGSYFIDRNPS